MKPINFKKHIKTGTCAAMRCKTAATHEWRIDDARAVIVCDEHGAALVAQRTAEAAAPAPAPPAPEEAPPTPTPAPTPAPVGVGDGEEATTVSVAHSAVHAIAEPLRVEHATMAAQLAAVQIVDQQSLDMAGELLQQVKGAQKKLETQRKSITKPMLDAKKAVDALFKPAAAAIEHAELILKDAIARYLDTVKAQQLAAHASDDPTALAAPAPTLPGSVSTRTIWKWEIVDPAQVPAEYWVIDASKVQGHVNAFKAQSQIPGIRVYCETGIASGSK
jgi:hypothetical protein